MGRQNVQRAPTAHHTAESVFLHRVIIGTLLFLCIFTPSILQPALSRLYNFLYSSSFYRFSGFETVETTLCYIILEPLYTYKFIKSPELRIDKRGSAQKTPVRENPKIPKMRRPSKRMGELFTYVAPLLAMDFVMIKKFVDVSIADIRASGGYPPLNYTRLSNDPISPYFLLPTIHNFKPTSPLQLIRAIPPAPPTSRRLVLELMTAFFIYDALFFFIHVAFHRIKILVRIHQPHHSHAEIHPQVTNQLSITERLSLVLLANFALNIIGSHVLTRTVFVPFFVYLLIEVHSGLDLPWGYDKIMPFGMGAGSAIHAAHHRRGEGAYQPFFCWWDRGLEWLESDRSRG